MILKQLEIISFGKFKNKTIDLTEGLNIIYGNNESGKSTVINFIYAILYGFGDNRGKGLSLRDKYTPWDGGVCEGKLLLKSDSGENLAIYRKAGNAKKYDILRIYNTDTGQDISLSPEEITGINSDTFFKTICLQQLSSAFEGSNDEIVARLSNIASSGDENISFDKAIRILENARREIRPQRGNGGMLSKISDEITFLEKKLDSRQAATAEINSLNLLLSTLKKEVFELKAQSEVEEKNDYTSRIAHLTGRIEEKSSHIRPSEKYLNFFILSSVFLLLTSIVSCFHSLKSALILFCLSLIGFFSGLLTKRKSTSDGLPELMQELQFLKEKQKLHERKLSELKANYFAASEKAAKLEVRIKLLRQSTQADAGDELNELYKKKQALEKKLRIINLTTDALSAAHEKMQSDFTPALNKIASAYFSAICAGKYNRIFCDEAFRLKVECDIPRESSFFSGGTVDQLYLSLRLALTDMLFGNKQTCIILDQPFLQYDDERKRNTVELLDNMSDKRQTLLFTGDKNVILSNKPTEILT